MHTIDFKAQNDSKTLRKEMLDLKQKQLNEEAVFHEEINRMQQSLEEKTVSEQDLRKEVRSLKKKLM